MPEIDTSLRHMPLLAPRVRGFGRVAEWVNPAGSVLVARRIAAIAVAIAIVGSIATPATLSGQQVDSARAGVRVRADSAASGQTAPGPAAPRAVATSAPDSLQPPVSPGRAFLLSLALPGLGQSRLNRPTAGGVYFVAEAVWLAMLGKAANDLRIAKAHANDVVVATYQVDPVTGRPIIVGGKYVPKDTVRSQYADPITTGGGVGADAQQQRSRVKARRLHFEDWIAMLAFNHLFSAADAYVSSHLWDLPAQMEIRALPRGSGVGVTIPFR